MRKLISSLLITLHCYGDSNTSWLEEVSNRSDPEAMTWLREQIKNADLKSNENFKNDSLQFFINKEEKCHQCTKGDLSTVEESKLMVFMSFSIPDNLWVALSKEVEKAGGIFVLRGLPNNSFQELAKKILRLKQLGVNAPIQINPKVFQQYEIQEVPCFVTISEQGLYDKISGNISLDFALNYIEKRGETAFEKESNQKELK